MDVRFIVKRGDSWNASEEDKDPLEEFPWLRPLVCDLAFTVHWSGETDKQWSALFIVDKTYDPIKLLSLEMRGPFQWGEVPPLPLVAGKLPTLYDIEAHIRSNLRRRD